jgi:hypothetical protein
MMVGGEQEEDMPDPVMEHALAVVARPLARPAFREDLRRRFCSEVPTAEREATPVPFHDPRDSRRRTFLRYGGLLAAAGILAIGFVVLESPAPRWKVVHVPEGSVVKIDGKAAPVDDTSALARSLSRAKEIEVEHGDLVLQIDDLVLFEADEGTRVAFEGFDRRGSGTEYSVRVPSGRLRAVTGPSFPGHTMKVEADLVDATVTGTAFAVDYEDHGTCVCCLEGEVQVSGPAIGANPMSVPPEHMCLVYRKIEAPPRWASAPFWHADPLRKLEDRAREIWR